jgi:hypothetical protein
MSKGELLLGALFLFVTTAQAQTPRAGDFDHPLKVAGLPLVHAGTTAGRPPGSAETYAGDPSAVLAGPEVVYQVDVSAPGTLRAWVEPEGGGDPDLVVLGSLARGPGGMLRDELDRADEVVEVSTAAARLYVVVETALPSAAGGYRLRVDWQPREGWHERPVARGVVLATRAYASLQGGPQTVSVLKVDPTISGVRVKPLGGVCDTVSRWARRAGAVAAVNGGYFGACRSVSLVKQGGSLLAFNARTRTAVGFDAAGRPRFAEVAAGSDWPGVPDALGGGPRLRSGGASDVRTAAESISPGVAQGRHPRTFVGTTPAGRLLLGAVDGRSPASAGMTLDQLSRWLGWLGASDALNLDGGGSTTLWVRGEPYRGVVNEPSDDGRPGHRGERPVTSILAVFAPPLEPGLRWLTQPPPGGSPWRYEAAVADPQGRPVRFAVEGPAAGAIVVLDHGDGTATLECSGPLPSGVTLKATAGSASALQSMP